METVEQKARELIGCDKYYCKSSDVNFCRTNIKNKNVKVCREMANMLQIADFVIESAINWLRENFTDYVDKIQDTYGGNPEEPQTYSLPDEFFSKFRREVRGTNYSVWVGGVEVNTEYLLKDEAEKLASIYKEKGYKDVSIEYVKK